MGCARADHPGCGSSWHTPHSPHRASHTLLLPQGESWGSLPWAQTTFPENGASPAVMLSLEGWWCPETCP